MTRSDDQAARAERQRITIHARRPERIEDLKKSIALIVETGGYPTKENT